MAILVAMTVRVWFQGSPGGPEEKQLQALAKQHGGHCWGQGTNIETGERDNSFDFPGAKEADEFREAVRPLILCFTSKAEK